MMKKLSIILISLLLCFIQHADSESCKVTISTDITNVTWEDIHYEKDKPDNCYNKLISQVNEEMKASMLYLSFASHFSQDSVNLPGFAKFFFESANEEREHAIKLLEYADIRGLPKKDKLLESLLGFTNMMPAQNDLSKIKSGAYALNAALQKEVDVTNQIKGIIKACEKIEKNETIKADNAETIQRTELNDYHLVDYLTGEFLDEQYKGQRHIVGMLSTLKKMNSAHGSLAEFLFDKKLLKGELF